MKKLLIILMMMIAGAAAKAQSIAIPDFYHETQYGSNWNFEWDTVMFNRWQVGNLMVADSVGRLGFNIEPQELLHINGLTGTYDYIHVLDNVSAAGITRFYLSTNALTVGDPTYALHQTNYGSFTNKTLSGVASIQKDEDATSIALQVQNTNTGANAGVMSSITTAGSGDPSLTIGNAGAFNEYWNIGMDNSASNALRISYGATSALSVNPSSAFNKFGLNTSGYIDMYAGLTGGSITTGHVLMWDGTKFTPSAESGAASVTSPLSLSSGTLSLPITDNQIVFGTGTSVQGDADLTFDDSNNHLSVATNWVALGGTNAENFNLHLQEDGRVELVGSGYSASKTVFAIRRANGTMASPTAILNGEIIGDLSYGGYKATAWSTSSVVALQAVATEDFDDSGTGSKLNLQVTANNSTGVVTAMTIDQDSKVIFENKIKEYNNAAPTDGQLLIGNTGGGTFDAATLTEGSAIDVTNGAGAITVGVDINELTTDNSYDYDDDYLAYYDAGEVANNKIVAGTLTRYALSVQATAANPADGATTYFGNMPADPLTTQGVAKIYMAEAGTITAADIVAYAVSTAGSNEAWSLYIRVNNTTDYLIETVSAATAERHFDNTALAISLSAGDYFEIKTVNPTWATNPTNVVIGGNITIK